MKIPGVERDEEGTIVIEISPTMRLVALSGVMIFVGVVVWWIAIEKEQEKLRKMSRVPGNILKPEEYTDEPDVLMGVEESIGVSPHSLLTIERLAGADREALETIFEEILNEGLPDLTSEEAQFYNSLIARSAEIAPNRSLRFYDMLEGGNQRSYSISQLYKKWITIRPLEAMETAKLVEEPLRFHMLSRDLLALAETRPSDAFEAALITRTDYFEHVVPDYIRPVVRLWGKSAFSAAEKSALELTYETGRKDAVQGLALAKLDQSSSWSDAYQWASDLANSQDRLWAQLTIAELGVHRHPDEAIDAVNNFPNLSLKKHLLRLVEAKRKALEYAPGDRRLKTWQLYRSTDPYDAHGRLCVANAFESIAEREKEAIYLRSRWRALRNTTFIADGYLLSGDVHLDVPESPLVNLLDRGDDSLNKDDLDAARADFLTYLHYNPAETDVDPYFTRWSKKANTWLGKDASILDEVTVPAAVVPEETPFFDVMEGLSKRYEEVTGSQLEFMVFEAISGKKPEILFAWGEHEEVSLREAIDTLTLYTGLTVRQKEYGIVCYYWRDEDVAMSMGSTIEEIPYLLD